MSKQQQQQNNKPIKQNKPEKKQKKNKKFVLFCFILHLFQYQIKHIDFWLMLLPFL
jgi:hypothetical protein